MLTLVIASLATAALALAALAMNGALIRDLREPRARLSEVVLVVEDDDQVRDSTVALLEDLDYSVLAARNGPEALSQLRAVQRVDILFTDVVLPQGMNGRVLSQEAAVLRPDLPVLFTTGYARNAIIHDGRLDPGCSFSQSLTPRGNSRINYAQCSMLPPRPEGRPAKTITLRATQRNSLKACGDQSFFPMPGMHQRLA
jgi:CheY-like chemotaxis protein